VKPIKKEVLEQPLWGAWPVAGLLARVILGIVFAASGLQKAAAPPQEFAAVVDTYRILSSDLVLPFAAGVPWAELIMGLFLLAGNMTRFAAASIGIMLLSFILAILSALVRNIPLENCGCFGSMIELTPLQALGLDAVLLMLAVVAFRHGKALFSMDRWVKS